MWDAASKAIETDFPKSWEPTMTSFAQNARHGDMKTWDSWRHEDLCHGVLILLWSGSSFVGPNFSPLDWE